MHKRLTTGTISRYNNLCLFGVKDMILNMKDMTTKELPVHYREKMDLSDFLKDRQDLASYGELEADLQAKAVGPTVEVEGTLEMPVTMLCSRCLAEVQEQLHISFRERFTRESLSTEEDESEDLHTVTEDKVDLKPFVEEAVWMALPFIPLCSEECKGLCPVCGTNRNERDCGCQDQKIDPRLAGLANFFKDNNE